jgi:hypothetical protein
MAKVTSSADRSKRAARSTAKVSGKTPTSRANRQKVSTAKVTGRGNFERANRQRTSTARVTTAGARSTAPGTPNASANARPAGRTVASNVASARMRKTLRTAAAGRAGATVAKAISAAKSLNPVGIAAETLKARPTAAGTLTSALKRGDYKPRQGPSVPKRLTQGGMDKGSFDSAFKASRAAGKKTFSWKGKKYTTKRKDDK